MVFENNLKSSFAEGLIMAEIKKKKYAWMNGKFVLSDEAKISVFSHSVHYGCGLFEGIRCYQCTDGRRAIFRLPDHIHRMFEGAAFLGIKIPYTLFQLCKAVVDLAKMNNLQDGDYIRPLVLIGEGGMGPLAKCNPIHVAFLNWEWGAYFGADALNKGIKVMVSQKWRRDNRVLPFHIKAIGHYVNSGLIKREAEEAGYDDGLVKDMDGHIVEASAANIFIVKRGELFTPHENSPILRGITRKSVIEIARNAGFCVKEAFIRDIALYLADEVFLTGTAAELTPVREIREWPVGNICPGPITRKLQELFFKATAGELPEYSRWLTHI